MDAVAVAVVLTVALFRAIGPRRTRAIAQIVAAVIGAAFAIGVQFAAILSYGTIPRMAVLQLAAAGWSSSRLTAAARLWWPARAVLGEPLALAGAARVSIVALAAA
jgi:ABC-2 type transport system permease protein